MMVKLEQVMMIKKQRETATPCGDSVEVQTDLNTFTFSWKHVTFLLFVHQSVIVLLCLFIW